MRVNRFKGIALCTDFDGTLQYREGEITKENIDAIRYFQSEGGIFTIISGRAPEYIEQFSDKIKVNTCLCGQNGACIKDYITKQVLFEDYIINPQFVIETILKYVPEIRTIDYRTSNSVSLPCENGKTLGKIPNEKAYKLLCRISDTTSIEESDRITAKIRELFGKDYSVFRSWYYGIEIQNKNCHKGSAVDFIRQYEKENAQMVICVGDFENDIPMLRITPYSFAVENAIPSVKAVCNFKTTSPEKSSIARIIEMLPDLSSRQIG